MDANAPSITHGRISPVPPPAWQRSTHSSQPHLPLEYYHLLIGQHLICIFVRLQMHFSDTKRYHYKVNLLIIRSRIERK